MACATPNGDHEGQRGQLERDLVARHRNRPHESDEQSGGAEHAELERLLCADGRAHAQQPHQRPEQERFAAERPQRRPEQRPSDPHEHEHHEPSGKARRPPGANRTELRSTQVSVHEDPVEEDVHDIGDAHRPQQRTNLAHRLQALAQHDEPVERIDSEDRRQGVCGRDGHDVRRLP